MKKNYMKIFFPVLATGGFIEISFIKKTKLFFLLFSLTSLSVGNTFAQYPNAVEQWSKPIKVDCLSDTFTWESSPCLSKGLDTMYLYINDGIFSSFLKNGKWQAPVRLNKNVNNNTPIRNPSISKDSKRLYYSRWGGYGGWNMWYSEHDSLTNDWGPSINMGASLNQYGGVFYAFELSPDTLYVVNNVWAEMGVCIYVKNHSTLEWEIVDSSNYDHLFGIGDIRGVSITGDRKKAYFSHYHLNSAADSLQSELYVTYWDTINKRWGNCYRLNINSNAYMPDPKNRFNWIGGWDEYPWISPDGKTLYFTSNRDAARSDTVAYPDIYMSKLLIDENGNPVTSVNQPAIKPNLPDNIKLYQNYPNPFNSQTVIAFHLDQTQNISLILFDILGKQISKIIDNKLYSAGNHSISLDVMKINVSSGVYFYRLVTNGSSAAKKIIYLQ